jgi:hypothetical protein
MPCAGQAVASASQKTDNRPGRLLRGGVEGKGRRSADKRQELPPPHAITSSAAGSEGDNPFSNCDPACIAKILSHRLPGGSAGRLDQWRP